MNLQDLRYAIDQLVAVGNGDPEGFHSMEDDLMRQWIRERSTAEEVRAWERLWTGDFIRWYA